MEPIVQPGTTPAPESFHIVIIEQGPYLIYGQPPLKQQFILPDKEGEMWYYKAGESFPTTDVPTALCRCGGSKKKPYCDGSHRTTEWNGKLTASTEPLLEGVLGYEGPEISITDNEAFCAFARFCDAKGRIWNLVHQDNPDTADLVIREANHCPGGRLSAWRDPATPVEPHFEPSLGLIEDPSIKCSGPLWVRGGIRVAQENGTTYEIRNRVTLCRCGHSSNKPYCDGTHASFKFKDGLPDKPHPDGEEF